MPETATSGTQDVILSVSGLDAGYRERRPGLLSGTRPVQVLNNVNLEVVRRSTVGLVGESGSGKSTLMNCLLRLHPVTAGMISFDEADLLAARAGQLRSIRRNIQAVFQNPFSSLDPRMHVSSLIAEPLRVHARLSRRMIQDRVDEVMTEVGLPRDLARAFPHQLSGGQAQRVAIARALTLRPALLLLDEPTSALDASVQAQIINLLMSLQEHQGLTYVFVSHDMALINHISDVIVVMYMGEIVEQGPARDVVDRPQHPYTQALLAAAGVGPSSLSGAALPGRADVPSFAAPPEGCWFHTRCPVAIDRCRTVRPSVYQATPAHEARCHLLDSRLDADDPAAAVRTSS